MALPRTHALHEVLGAAVSRVAEIHGPTLALGAGSLIFLLVLERLAPRLPRALLLMVAVTLLVWGLRWDASGVAVVGEVPSGLPVLALPGLFTLPLGELLPAALTISVVAYVESISVARAFARQGGYTIDPRRELFGLSLANFGGALVGAFPVTGGFGRTAVNAQAGARSPLASLVSGAVIVLTLLFLTPLFQHLPRAALAAIIVLAVSKLFDAAELARLWREQRSAFTEAAVTFADTLALGIEVGLALGVVWSLLGRAIVRRRSAAAVESAA